MDYQDALKEALKQDLIKRGIPLKDSLEGSFSSKNSQEGEYESSLREALKQDLIKRGIPINEEVSKEQDSESFRWPRFVGEHTAKGVLDAADFGQMAAHYVPKGVGKALEFLYPADISMIGQAGKYLANRPAPTPISKQTKEALIRDYGFDLDSQGEGNTPAQRILGHGARFAGGMITPGAGALKALPKVGGLFAKEAIAPSARSIAASGAMGAGSGYLQEAGVPGLLADLLSIAGGSLAPGLARKAFGPNVPKLSPEELKVGKNLQEFVGERQLPTVRENLLKPSGVQNYEPMTAELANNPSIGQIHRARLGIPGAGLADQAGRQNEAIMSLVEKNSIKAPHPSEISELVYDELKGKKIARHNATHKDYEAVEKMNDKIAPENLRKFLKSKPAAGKILSDLNEVRRDTGLNKKLSKADLEYARLYKNASADVRKNMPKPALIESKISKLAAADKALTAKIEKLEGTRENSRRKVLKLAQEELQKDLSHIETYKRAKSEYARLSKPINLIEKSTTLRKIPKGELNSVMNLLYSGKSAKNMARMKKFFEDNPEKWELIQHASVDHFKNRILNAGAEGRSHVISSPKINKFIKEHDKAMEIVYTPEQMEVIKSIRDAVKGQNVAKTSGEGPGSPTQARQMTDKILARGLGTKGLEFATKVATLKSPILGGLEHVAQHSEKKLLDVLDKSLREPEFAHKLLTHDFKSPKEVSEFLYTATKRTPVLMRNRKDEERTGVTRNGKTFPYTLKATQD